MPELPEVETLCRQLRRSVLNERIDDILILDAKIKGVFDCRSERIKKIKRHGKWFEAELSGGRTLRFHLRMTGSLVYFSEPGLDAHPVHGRLLIRFKKGCLYLIDPRRFATVELPDKQTKLLPGRDALEEAGPEFLSEAARNRSVSIKTFLLDQKIISGIGNIYACEILHAAGIDPFKKASCITVKEWSRISGSMKQILEAAISCRGTSVSDWRDLFGKRGEYQHRLRVYKREGEACLRCGAVIARIRQNGRSTFYCPACQQTH